MVTLLRWRIYEKGIGVDQDYDKASALYKRVLRHHHPREEAMHDSLTALARYHGLGLSKDAEHSQVVADRFATMSQSNPERREELEHLENRYLTLR
jgi:TPR repeat protein